MRYRYESSFILCRTLLALVLVLFGSLSALAQCNVQQIAKLLAEDGEAGDKFGISVSIDGTTAIVGARYDDDNGVDSGSGYLFNTATGQQIAKLLPDDGAADDNFGASVSISGTIAVVGASYDDDNGTNSGSAYAFDTTTGEQIAKLLPNDGAATDRFGGSVAISGTTAIVGVQYDDDNGPGSGSAYVFDTSTGQQIAKILPDDGTQGARFGKSVAISGTMAIIAGGGAAYVFDTMTGQQLIKLLPDHAAAGFGRSVSISGTIAIVGAYGDQASGSAFLFDTTTGQQIANLLPDDGSQGDYFGWSVSISGTIAIVGSSADAPHDDGSAYLFNSTNGQQIAKILADDGAQQGDRFGFFVAICDNTAIVGAPFNDDDGSDSGSAYLFDIGCFVVVPHSFFVTRGSYVAGGAAELLESDNADLSIRRSTADTQSRTEFEVKGVSPVASPSTLEVTLEGSVFARSQVDQTIELFDYVAGAWVQVDTRTATHFSDSTATVAATGDLFRFVEAGTMCVQARIRYQSTNLRQRFSSNTDQFIWTIGQ